MKCSVLEMAWSALPLWTKPSHSLKQRSLCSTERPTVSYDGHSNSHWHGEGRHAIARRDAGGGGGAGAGGNCPSLLWFWEVVFCFVLLFCLSAQRSVMHIDDVNFATIFFLQVWKKKHASVLPPLLSDFFRTGAFLFLTWRCIIKVFFNP